MTAPAPAPTAAPAPYSALQERFAPLLAQIAEGAAARDRDRVLPHAEVRALAAAGFTAVTVPVEHGGAGAGTETLFRLLVDLAEADSNLPQLLRAHFAFIDGLLRGDEAGDAAVWFAEIAGGAVLGNASHERSTATVGELSTTVTPHGDDFRLTGVKHYSTGSIFADWILVSAVTPQGRRARVTVGLHDQGVRAQDDWDGFGQTLTGSGTTVFEQVQVPAARVQVLEGGDGVSTTRTSFLQLVLLASLVGVGRAALREGISFVRTRTRVYSQGSGSTATEDPLVQQVIGRLSAKVAAAQDSVLAAASALARAQDALGTEQAEALTDAAELRTAQAQITSFEGILEVATELFEVGGASATSRGRALDRHWRNARTLASHNPVIYQERAVGDRLLNGAELLYFWSTGESRRGQDSAPAAEATPASAR